MAFTEIWQWGRGLNHWGSNQILPGWGTAGEGQRQICARDSKWAALFRKSWDKDVTKGWRAEAEGEELRATDASHRPALSGNPGNGGMLPAGGQG